MAALVGKGNGIFRHINYWYLSPATAAYVVLASLSMYRIQCGCGNLCTNVSVIMVPRLDNDVYYND